VKTFSVARGVVRRSWWSRFHPWVRVGWSATKVGLRNENFTIANIGFALMAAGVVSRSLGKREHLYSGGLEPGQQMRIVVERRGVRTERLIEG